MDQLTSSDTPPPAVLAENLLSRWYLRPDVTFLNHGSFGAAPKAVMDEQNLWRTRLEAEPIELLGRGAPRLVAQAKIPVGELLGMTPADFGLVTNATEGVNAVLHCLKFAKGDELLTTTHVYNAVRQAMKHTAGRFEASYREIEIRTPVAGAKQIAQTILGQLSDRTRLLVIDHITSPTALVFPVKEIVAGCTSRGIDVLVDGAHAPGMIGLNVPAVGAAYYAGNLHKWCCAAKGCAFLWVKPGRAGDIHPCTVSHLYGQGLAEEFSWQGTRDISAWLTIPAALRFMADLGWERVRVHNHAMAAWAQRMLCKRFEVAPMSPLDGSLIGATATVELPGKLAGMSQEAGQALGQVIYDEDRVEVPLVYWQDRWHLRVSCQVYNQPADYERLAEVMLRRGR